MAGHDQIVIKFKKFIKHKIASSRTERTGKLNNTINQFNVRQSRQFTIRGTLAKLFYKLKQTGLPDIILNFIILHSLQEIQESGYLAFKSRHTIAENVKKNRQHRTVDIFIVLFSSCF